MAFAPGGSQPPSPFLPGSLISTRLGFHGQRRASDPFSPSSGSRSSSSTHTGQTKSPEYSSLASMMAAKIDMAGVRMSADATQGIASHQALGYLRTASLPHVPTQALAPGLMQQVETPAMANPRKCSSTDPDWMLVQTSCLSTDLLRFVASCASCHIWPFTYRADVLSVQAAKA